MTRYPPQGGYQGGDDPYGYQRHQGAGSQSGYGAYNSGEGQGYNNAPNYQAPQYGEPQHQQQGTAQGYYGSNDQAYQQYPPHNNSQYGGYEAQQPQGYQHGGYEPQQSYGGQQHPGSPPPQGPPHAQQYANQQQHYPYGQVPPYPGSVSSNQGYGQYAVPYGPPGGASVEAFKSHYEQPHGAIDPTTNQAMPPPVAIDPATGQPFPPEAEGDRGLMGALAGGAAGAYGGHKMGHGFLGGVGGAVAGSMLEDAYKKKGKKDKKEKKARRGSHSSSSSDDSSCDSDDSKKKKKRAGGGMLGNFSASSRGIFLEGRCTLVAECCNTHGHHHRSHLDLNDCLTNSNGRLEWARGGGFANSAREIRLVDGGRVVEAELGNGRGGWNWDGRRLDERITNEDGRLEML
ncbi:hypothetical protein LTR86_001879 [Recurvomyces mirabilis]|nr:hypothetical protein LTR86_001879 [Recurvomyces mirabilis]